jgi:transaldolase
VFEAHAKGQSIWLDNISRDLLLSGELRRWVEREGIRGVTSNPSIFEKAIAKTSDYDPAARALIAQGASDALDVFEKLAVADIQLGCDVLRPVWEESGGRDGYVSLEVSPHLANDTQGTIAEAHRFAKAVSRDNLLIKVPATPEGIPAIQALIADGISINVTLLFAIDAYEAVHQAYIAGLETRLARGQSVSGIASVASFFISRIDAAVGQQIDVVLEKETRKDRRERLTALNAKVAIANAKLAYGSFLETLAGDRWKKLAAAGADPQRVLWASTGTKDPALPKTLYVDELIGNYTVNTLPDATLAAFRAEGTVRDVLGTDPIPLKAEAQAVLSELETLGISLKEITDRLLTKGCALFSDAFDGLLLSVETKRQQLLGSALATTRYALGDYQSDVDAARQSWQEEGQSRMLWNRKASIFRSPARRSRSGAPPFAKPFAATTPRRSLSSAWAARASGQTYWVELCTMPPQPPQEVRAERAPMDDPARSESSTRPFPTPHSRSSADSTSSVASSLFHRSPDRRSRRTRSSSSYTRDSSKQSAKKQRVDNSLRSRIQEVPSKRWQPRSAFSESRWADRMSVADSRPSRPSGFFQPRRWASIPKHCWPAPERCRPPVRPLSRPTSIPASASERPWASSPDRAATSSH